MSLAALDNLARIGQIKPEPRNEAEVRRMQAMARTRLSDARLDKTLVQRQFDALVCVLYGLTDEEICIVKAGTHISR